MEPFEVKILIKKYQSGKCTEEEKRLLESWYAFRNPDTINQLNAQEFQEDLLLIGQGLPLASVPEKKTISWPKIISAAASLLLIATAYLFYPILKDALPGTEMVSLRSPLKQTRELVLPDKSQVWINAQSTLKYPALFKGDSREVFLSGEAYFDISHNDKPFIIHTGKLSVTVLGTAFNIKEDKIEGSVTVTVARGKVRVANGNQILGVITPNEQIKFDLQNNRYSKQTVNALHVTPWKKIDLSFEDVTFEEAARQIEARYNVKVIFKNSGLKNCRFTGASINGESISQVLDVICTFNQATYQLNADGTVLIDGPGCGNRSENIR